ACIHNLLDGGLTASEPNECHTTGGDLRLEGQQTLVNAAELFDAELAVVDPAAADEVLPVDAPGRLGPAQGVDHVADSRVANDQARIIEQRAFGRVEQPAVEASDLKLAGVDAVV